MRIRPMLLACTTLGIATPAHAQDARLDALESRLAAQDQRIRDLEALVARQSGLLRQATVPTPVASAPVTAPAPPAPTTTCAPALASTSAASGALFRVPGLDVTADMRVRPEWNFVDGRER